MENELVSIMCVTYNRLNLTKLTIQNLIKTVDRAFELIIIDNCSTDGTVEYLKTELLEMLRENNFCLESKIIFNNINFGIAYARNQALLKTSGYWLVTIDNDIELPTGWLTEAIDIIKTNQKFGMIGVNFENIQYPLINLNKKEFQIKSQGNLGTACVVFPKSLHQMLGFFCLDYPNYAHEDADYGMRARVAGYSMGYIKENGKHLGQGENDKGDYRAFKDKYVKENLGKFHENCRLYIQGKKPIYISFKDK